MKIVDDSGGDRGNDGYDVGRQLLVSIYCPEKPETAEYRRKALSDLQKVLNLQSAPGYTIKGWIFVTPTALREPLQAELRNSAGQQGLSVTFMSDIHLEDMYRRHAELHDEFPELEYPQVASALAAIQAALTPAKASPRAAHSEAQRETAVVDVRDYSIKSLGLLRGFIAPTLDSLRERLLAGDASATDELERFRLEAIDPRDSLGALLIELEFEANPMNSVRYVEISREGLALARSHGVIAERAVFAVCLAHALVHQLVSRHLDVVTILAYMSISGVAPTVPHELSVIQTQLDSLKTEVDDLLNEAVQSANESADVAAQFIVSIRLGSIAAQRFFPYRLASEMGIDSDPDARSFFFNQMREAYSSAIPRAKMLGQAQLAQAYHNYANDLVVFGEYKKARSHADHALRLARKVNDEHQVGKSEMLIAKIRREETG